MFASAQLISYIQALSFLVASGRNISNMRPSYEWDLMRQDNNFCSLLHLTSEFFIECSLLGKLNFLNQSIAFISFKCLSVGTTRNENLHQKLSWIDKIEGPGKASQTINKLY